MESFSISRLRPVVTDLALMHRSSVSGMAVVVAMLASTGTSSSNTTPIQGT